MRIEPGNPNLPPGGSRRSGRATQRSTPSSSSISSSEPASDSTVSADIAPLVTSLMDQPEVRMDVVEEVRQRLNRGEHLTRAAAERTAEAILADLASFIGQ